MEQQKTWKFRFAVCIVALWLASGCANKNNVAENEQTDGFAETAASDPGAAPTEGASADPAEAELFGDPAGDANKTADAGGQDPAMDELFDNNPQQTAQTEPNLDELAGQPTDPAATTAAEPPPPTEPAPTTDPAADPLLAGGSSTLSDPATPTDAQAFSPSPSFAEKPEPKSYAGAILPKIPERAVTRKGKSLNRYYFLRNGDNAKSVSELVYGDASHAGDLKKWNKGRWIPGKVVYYASPSQPDDAQMVSLYDERGLTPEEHTVAKGETMSSIAKNKLGSLSSWKELAIVNGLSSPDTLRRGQTIKLFTNLGASQAPPPVAQAQPVAEPPPQPVPVAPPPPAIDPVAQNQAAGAVDPSQDPFASDLSKPKTKKSKGLNIQKLLTQNAFSIMMGLGIGLLLVSMLMINKRKKSGGGGGIEEFNEDAFAAPGKKKRR